MAVAYCFGPATRHKNNRQEEQGANSDSAPSSLLATKLGAPSQVTGFVSRDVRTARPPRQGHRHVAWGGAKRNPKTRAKPYGAPVGGAGISVPIPTYPPAVFNAMGLQRRTPPQMRCAYDGGEMMLEYVRVMEGLLRPCRGCPLGEASIVGFRFAPPQATCRCPCGADGPRRCRHGDTGCGPTRRAARGSWPRCSKRRHGARRRHWRNRVRA